MIEILDKKNAIATHIQFSLLSKFIRFLKDKEVPVIENSVELGWLNRKLDTGHRISGEWGAFFIIRCPFHKFDLKTLCFENSLAINKYTRACWCMYERKEYKITEVIRAYLSDKEINILLNGGLNG